MTKYQTIRAASKAVGINRTDFYKNLRRLGFKLEKKVYGNEEWRKLVDL